MCFNITYMSFLRFPPSPSRAHLCGFILFYFIFTFVVLDCQVTLASKKPPDSDRGSLLFLSVFTYVWKMCFEILSLCYYLKHTIFPVIPK